MVSGRENVLKPIFYFLENAPTVIFCSSDVQTTGSANPTDFSFQIFLDIICDFLHSKVPGDFGSLRLISNG